MTTAHFKLLILKFIKIGEPITHLRTFVKDAKVLFLKENKRCPSTILHPKEQLGDRLQVKWEVDKVKDVKIPPLSLQTLVEKAVNHGVLKRIGGEKESSQMVWC